MLHYRLEHSVTFHYMLTLTLNILSYYVVCHPKFPARTSYPFPGHIQSENRHRVLVLQALHYSPAGREPAGFSKCTLPHLAMTGGLRLLEERKASECKHLYNAAFKLEGVIEGNQWGASPGPGERGSASRPPVEPYSGARPNVQ
jgi:hypothetical protein